MIQDIDDQRDAWAVAEDVAGVHRHVAGHALGASWLSRTSRTARRRARGVLRCCGGFTSFMRLVSITMPFFIDFEAVRTASMASTRPNHLEIASKSKEKPPTTTIPHDPKPPRRPSSRSSAD